MLRKGITGFGAAALRIASWTLLSRVLGLVRDRAMFGLFGRGYELGAFHLAWTVPNTFRRLLGEGALSAAFVPVLTKRLDQDGVEAARRSVAAVLGALLFVLASLLVLGQLLVALLPTSALASDQAPAYGELLRSLLFILLPYLLPVCLLTLAAGAQNARGYFSLPAFAPAVLNAVWILAVLFVATREGSLGEKAIWIAYCVLAGGLLQLFVQLPGLARSGLLTAPRLAWRDPDLRRVARAMLPMLLGLSVLQLNTLTTQFLAAFLVDRGAPSIVFLGNRLLEFPHALLGIALGTAVFPLLSLLGSRGQHAELHATVGRALGIGLFFALPAAAGLFALAPMLVEVLFRSGRFDAEAALEASRVTRILSLALPGLIGVQILARTHYALGDMRSPVRIAVLLFFVAQGLNVSLAPHLGTAGLAISSAVAASANALLLAYSLRKQVGAAKLPGIRAALLRASLAAVPTAGTAWLVAQGMQRLEPAGLFVRILALLLLPGLCGLVLFFALAALMRAPELRELRSGLARRKAGRGAGRGAAN